MKISKTDLETIENIVKQFRNDYSKIEEKLLRLRMIKFLALIEDDIKLGDTIKSIDYYGEDIVLMVQKKEIKITYDKHFYYSYYGCSDIKNIEMKILEYGGFDVETVDIFETPQNEIRIKNFDLYNPKTLTTDFNYIYSVNLETHKHIIPLILEPLNRIIKILNNYSLSFKNKFEPDYFKVFKKEIVIWGKEYPIHERFLQGDSIHYNITKSIYINLNGLNSAGEIIEKKIPISNLYPLDNIIQFKDLF